MIKKKHQKITKNKFKKQNKQKLKNRAWIKTKKCDDNE